MTDGLFGLTDAPFGLTDILGRVLESPPKRSGAGASFFCENIIEIWIQLKKYILGNLNLSQMQEINLETVKKLLNSSVLELTATQEALCLPILLRIYKKMKIGIQFEGIKVKDSRIVDGHHRYICSQLAEVKIEHFEWEIAKSAVEHDWSKVIIDEEDWENEEDIKVHDQKDAERNNMDESIFKDL